MEKIEDRKCQCPDPKCNRPAECRAVEDGKYYTVEHFFEAMDKVGDVGDFQVFSEETSQKPPTAYEDTSGATKPTPSQARSRRPARKPVREPVNGSEKPIANKAENPPKIKKSKKEFVI